jgi:hypothetical protein
MKHINSSWLRNADWMLEQKTSSKLVRGVCCVKLGHCYLKEWGGMQGNRHLGFA